MKGWKNRFDESFICGSFEYCESSDNIGGQLEFQGYDVEGNLALQTTAVW